AQQRILANYSFALQRRGFLMLGKAEALQSRTNLFEAFDLKHRIFVKNPSIEGEARLPRVSAPAADAPDAADGALREASFDQAPVAQLIVEKSGRVVSINYAARAMFGLRMADAGRLLQDLEVSYRPLD